MEEEHARRQSAIHDISSLHGVSVKTARCTLGLMSKKESRAVNLRNTWIHLHKYDTDTFPGKYFHYIPHSHYLNTPYSFQR